MAACSKYVTRLKIALTHRGVNMPTDVVNLMAKKAKSDGILDDIILRVLDVIEPPYCQMRHCSNHTTKGFCGCSLSLVPGKCSLNLSYLKNKRIREEKKYQSRVEQLPNRFFPLTKENETKLRTMSDDVWDKAIRKYLRQEKRAVI